MLLVVWPLMAAFHVPDVRVPLPPYMLAAAMDVPPDVPPVAQPETPAVEVNVDAAPIAAPDSITPEVPRLEVTGVPAVSGGLPGVTVSGSGLFSTRPTPPTPPKPPTPPTPPAPVRVGGNVDAPVRTTYTAPTYPPLAQAARVDGTVILEATIDAQGVVQDVRVLRSVPLLDAAAIEAVRQWRYRPTRLNGQAVPVIMTVTVTFSLK